MFLHFEEFNSHTDDNDAVECWLLSDDSFIAILVQSIPSMLSLVDAANWWPQRVPRKNLMDQHGKIVKKTRRRGQERFEAIKEVDSQATSNLEDSLAKGNVRAHRRR